MGEDVRGLQIQLSTALRELEGARGEAAMYKQRYFEKGADSQQWAAQAGSLRAENGRLETAARAYIEGHELALTRAEAAESERDALRGQLEEEKAMAGRLGDRAWEAESERDDLRVERDNLRGEVKRLRETAEKAADTFRDLQTVFRVSGKVGCERACQIAEDYTRAALAGGGEDGR